GIAESKQRALRPVAAGERLQHVDGRGHRETVRDLQRRPFGTVIGRMEDKAAAVLDRTAEMHPRLRRSASRIDVELPEEVAYLEIAGGLVDDQPHRAVRRMRAEEDHRAVEPGIAHARHGDQELAVEEGTIAVHPGANYVAAGGMQAEARLAGK